MNILLTGGTGYIGSHTAVALIEQGHRVTIIDNLCNSKWNVVERIAALTGQRCRFYQEDIRDENALNRIFSENDYDAVIHMAGLKAIGESVSNPLTYYANNVAGTITLCEAMERNGVRNMVFSSSATVYGACETIPITEDAPVGTTNPYGRTKLMIEDILRDLSTANPAWRVMLLRYFNPIGAHSSGCIGERPSGVPNNLMPYITRVATGKSEKLMVFGNDYPTKDGTGVRDYIHITDLAEGHVAALEKLSGLSPFNVFNLGTGEGHSVLEVIKCFEEVTGVSVPYEITPRRSGDVAVCYADVSKAQRDLGWRAKYTLTEMCRDAWNWQKSIMNQE